MSENIQLNTEYTQHFDADLLQEEWEVKRKRANARYQTHLCELSIDPEANNNERNQHHRN